MEMIILSLTLSTLFASVYPAPVLQSKFGGLANALKAQLKNEESALASLGALQDEVDSPKSLGISKSKSFSYSNINGAVQKEQTQEQKVTNPAAEEVISDIKQHVQQSQSSPDVEPQTSFDAKLDIPAAGVHKEISSNDNQIPQSAMNMQPQNFKDTIEFTPEVVAQYLYDHEAKSDFLNLLNELVETSEITSEEAEQYERSVMDELYKMEQASKRSGNDANEPMLDQMLPQGYGDTQQPLYPMYNDAQTNDELYPIYGYGQGPMKAAQEPVENVDNYINYVLNKPVTLDDMINNLLDEWLAKAIVTGDPEAEEILTNIVDYVSRDNNPNDEEQVKAVLGEIFAEALLEDLTPRLQPEDLKDINLSPAFRPEMMQPVHLPEEQESSESKEQHTAQDEAAEVSNVQTQAEESSETASNDEDMNNDKQAKMKK